MAISVDLGGPLEQFVDDLVRNGRYGSKSEILREGVRLIQDREAKLVALDASLRKAIADIDAGRGIPAEEAFDRLLARYDEKK
jgi:antitoxin ParD1/3/4